MYFVFKAILFIMLLPCFIKSQNDSSKVFLRTHNIIGAGVGYSASNLPYFSDRGYQYYGDVNLNYLFSIKHFALKAKIVLQPNTSFGLKFNGSISTGFTCKINKSISSHFLAGWGASNATKHSDNTTTYGYIRYPPNTSLFLNNGYYFSRSSNKGVFFGIDFFYWSEFYTYVGGGGETQNRYLAFSLSINYLFKNDKTAN